MTEYVQLSHAALSTYKNPCGSICLSFARVYSVGSLAKRKVFSMQEAKFVVESYNGKFWDVLKYVRTKAEAIAEWQRYANDYRHQVRYRSLASDSK